MINPFQFRECVIEAPLNVLATYAPKTRATLPQAADQLFMLAAHESKLGTYLQQLWDGPLGPNALKSRALGVYQIEPQVIDWLLSDYLKRSNVTGFKACLHAFAFPDTFSPSGFNHRLFAINLAAQTVAARTLLWSKTEALPDPQAFTLGRNDPAYFQAHAEYAKRHWNKGGKATPADYLNATLKLIPA